MDTEPMSKKSVVYILLGIIAFALSVRMITFAVPHVENDEVIYITLAKKLIQHPWEYNLQGTGILQQLPGSYDRPFFIHPPVFFLLLALCYKFLGAIAALALSSLFDIGIILGGFLLARYFYSDREALVTAFVLSVCPIHLLESSKVWLDTTVVFFSVIGFYLFVRGWDALRKDTLFWAGFVLGLAILSKYSAFWLMPVVFIYALSSFRKSPQTMKGLLGNGLVFLAGMAILLVPWAIVYGSANGSLDYLSGYSWSNEEMARFPFVYEVFHRPDSFYFVALFFLTPLYALALGSFFKMEEVRKTTVLWAWVVVYLLGHVILFKLGHLGYIFRYLLPVTVPLAILSARQIVRWPTILVPAAILLGAYELMIGIYNMLSVGNADVHWLNIFQAVH
jgi:4-amino-4-deoxy-L-arabinose transferase-like glycosyltransferase